MGRNENSKAQYMHDYYVLNKEVLNKRRKVNNKNRIRIHRYKVAKIKSERGCSLCGETDSRCLAFHHHNDDKEDTVSNLVGQGASWKRIENEMAKCQVLCSNCHMKLTHPPLKKPILEDAKSKGKLKSLKGVVV